MILFALVLSSNDSAVYASSSGGWIDYGGIRDEDDRVSFIEQFGIKVLREGREEMSFSMPENFDRVILGYNELQKKQGLDLSKYARKKVTRYTYKVTNYEGYEGTVYANIIVYRSKVIAGDICSADSKGFMHTLYMPEKN